MRALLEDLKQTCAGVAWDVREKPLDGQEALAFALHLIRECRRYLGDAERVVEAELAATLGGAKSALVAGLGTVERKAAPVKPKWDNEGLGVLLARLAQKERKLNESTGEIEDPELAAMRVLLECASVSYWRVGKLNERGIDAKAYREQEGWRETVRVIPEGNALVPDEVAR